MATEIKIKNIPEGYQSIISNGRHTILGDEPINAKGTDLGFSPSELVLSGLAMCKVATVRYIANKNGWKINDIKAKLSQEVKREDGKLKPQIQVLIEIEGELNEEQKSELLKQADNCYVHRLLMSDWEIAHSESSKINS